MWKRLKMPICICVILAGQASYIYLTYIISIHLHNKELQEKADNLKGRQLTAYAQFSDDVVLEELFRNLGINKIRYLDIGAWDPIRDSNTYLFYEKGHSGVLVEPNPAKVELLRKTRPRDMVLSFGIGVTTDGQADYYASVDPTFSGLNTFSKEWADIHEKKGIRMKTVRMPLVNINTVIKDNFDQPPNFISIDVEGFDLDILKSMDFDKYRPAVICAETLIVHTLRMDRRIEEFMRTKRYSIRGATIANSMFVDDDLTEK